MKNRFIIKEVKVNNNRIDYSYEIEGEWKKYFLNKESLFIEYSVDISDTPYNIAIIPLICNILPLVWIMDAEIVIEELDKDFYESIPRFKEGYIKMYPNIEFKGVIKSKNIVENSYVSDEKTAVFFSGGVDAFSTLITHIEENPILLTIWGADIKIEDENSWNTVSSQIKKTANDFNLKNVFIKSNFREIVSEKEFDEYIKKKVDDGWWHGFQHGIGLISLAAPFSYVNKIKQVYIASSHTENDRVACASDPTIDNYLKLSKCDVIHDGFEYNRQDKVHNITEYMKENKRHIFLRVCWQANSNGKNCCKCEKCYRTIYGLIAENVNPNDYGLPIEKEGIKKSKSDIKNKLFIKGSLGHWKDIQKAFIQNRDNIINSKDISWIYTVNFDKINKTPMKTLRKVKRKICKAMKVLK